MRPLSYANAIASGNGGDTDLVMDFAPSTFASLDHASGCACCAMPGKGIGSSGISASWGEVTYEGPNGGGDTVGATIGSAGTIAVGATINGVTDFSGDRDYYAITVTAGQAI